MSPYLIALLIGLIIGVDRERRGMLGRQAMGVRSYILFALVGALAGGVNEPMFTLGLLIFATGITLYGYMKTSKLPKSQDDPIGLTSEIAAMATFALGYFAHSEPFITLALGAIILFILHNKSLFHQFVRTHLRPAEVQSASVLFLLAVGVIPLMPNRTIDPWHIFNPRRLAVIIVILASIQFGGYIATRLFGSRIGLPLSGFFAGIASSTAAFISFPKIAKAKPSDAKPVVAAALLSITGTLCLFTVVVGAISWPLVLSICIPLGSFIALTAATGVWLSYHHKTTSESVHEANPLNLWSASKLGVLLMILIFAVDLSERFLGSNFTKLLTFLGGLFDLHGVVIASANMLENGTVTLEGAASAALIAITASMVSKVFITAFMSEGRYRQLMLPIIIGLFLVSGAFWVLVTLLPYVLVTV